METLLEKTKIGDTMSIGAQKEGDELGLFIASPEVSASLAFEISKDEWKKFVEVVEKIDKSLGENS